MPVPFPAFGVTITLAPSIRMSLRRSIENGSAIVITQGYPLCAHIIATAVYIRICAYDVHKKDIIMSGRIQIYLIITRQMISYLDYLPIPVLPLVASTTVCPGFKVPSFSAASMIAKANRSFTDDSGLKYSALA